MAISKRIFGSDIPNEIKKKLNTREKLATGYISANRFQNDFNINDNDKGIQDPWSTDSSWNDIFSDDYLAASSFPGGRNMDPSLAGTDIDDMQGKEKNSEIYPQGFSESAYGSFGLSPGADPHGKTPFVRMWTGVKLVKYRQLEYKDADDKDAKAMVPEKVFNTQIYQLGGHEGTGYLELEPDNPDADKLAKDGHTYHAKFKIIDGILYRQTIPIVPAANAETTATFGGEYSDDWLDQEGNPIGTTDMVLDVNNSRWLYGDPDQISQVKKDIADFAVDPALMKAIAPGEGQTNNNQFMKPPAGITSVDSETEGALGEVKRTRVNFVVHNFHDFENIFMRYFLKPMAQVVIDFGWSHQGLYDQYKYFGGDETTDPDYDQFETKIFGDDGLLIKSAGDLDVIIGHVVDFESKVNTEGSWECMIEVLSKNNALIDRKFSEEEAVNARIAKNIDYRCIQHASSFFGDSWYNFFKYDTQILKDVKSQYAAGALGANFDHKVVNPNYTLLAEYWASKFLSNQQGLNFQPLGEHTRTGVFWQTKTANRTIKIQNQEKIVNYVSEGDNLYISWGVFEDLILNPELGHGPTMKSINAKDNMSISFDSSNCFVRWSPMLHSLREDLANYSLKEFAFLYPSQWNESYNRFLGKQPEDCNIEGKNKAYLIKEENPVTGASLDPNANYLETFSHPRLGLYETRQGDGSDKLPHSKSTFQHYADGYEGYDNSEYSGYTSSDMSVGRIPMRELFIRVSVIKEAFKSAKSFRDAINKILESINENSYGIFNIQMRPKNYPCTGFEFTDANYVNYINSNLSPDDDNENMDVLESDWFENLYTFKPYSRSSYIKSLDLKFTTPKGDYGNALAVQALLPGQRITPYDSITDRIVTQKLLDEFDIMNYIDDIGTIISRGTGFVYVPEVGGHIGEANIGLTDEEYVKMIEDGIDPMGSSFQGKKYVDDGFMDTVNIAKTARTGQWFPNQNQKQKQETEDWFNTLESQITDKSLVDFFTDRNEQVMVSEGDNSKYIDKVRLADTSGAILKPKNKDLKGAKLWDPSNLEVNYNWGPGKTIDWYKHSWNLSKPDPNLMWKVRGVDVSRDTSGLANEDGTVKVSGDKKVALARFYQRNYASLLPVELSITIPGIGSLVPGDLFRVDYLPERYRKNVFFQISKITHNVSMEGWDTKIDCYMKYPPQNKKYSDLQEDNFKTMLTQQELNKQFGDQLPTHFLTWVKDSRVFDITLPMNESRTARSEFIQVAKRFTVNEKGHGQFLMQAQFNPFSNGYTAPNAGSAGWRFRDNRYAYLSIYPIEYHQGEYGYDATSGYQPSKRMSMGILYDPILFNPTNDPRFSNAPPFTEERVAYFGHAYGEFIPNAGGEDYMGAFDTDDLTSEEIEELYDSFDGALMESAKSLAEADPKNENPSNPYRDFRMGKGLALDSAFQMKGRLKDISPNWQHSYTIGDGQSGDYNGPKWEELENPPRSSYSVNSDGTVSGAQFGLDSLGHNVATMGNVATQIWNLGFQSSVELYENGLVPKEDLYGFAARWIGPTYRSLALAAFDANNSRDVYVDEYTKIIGGQVAGSGYIGQFSPVDHLHDGEAWGKSVQTNRGRFGAPVGHIFTYNDAINDMGEIYNTQYLNSRQAGYMWSQQEQSQVKMQAMECNLGSPLLYKLNNNPRPDDRGHPVGTFKRCSFAEDFRYKASKGKYPCPESAMDGMNGYCYPYAIPELKTRVATGDTSFRYEKECKFVPIGVDNYRRAEITRNSEAKAYGFGITDTDCGIHNVDSREQGAMLSKMDTVNNWGNACYAAGIWTNPLNKNKSYTVPWTDIELKWNDYVRDDSGDRGGRTKCRFDRANAGENYNGSSASSKEKRKRYWPPVIRHIDTTAYVPVAQLRFDWIYRTVLSQDKTYVIYNYKDGMQGQNWLVIPDALSAVITPEAFAKAQFLAKNFFVPTDNELYTIASLDYNSKYTTDRLNNGK